MHVSTVTPKHICLKYILRKRIFLNIFFIALPETFSAILAPISATALLRSDTGSALGRVLLARLINFGMNMCRKGRCHEIFHGGLGPHGSME